MLSAAKSLRGRGSTQSRGPRASGRLSVLERGAEGRAKGEGEAGVGEAGDGLAPRTVHDFAPQRPRAAGGAAEEGQCRGTAPSSLLRIPVIGSIARGDQQRLNCSMRGSMEPRIEQFSR